jgi:S-adenosylmethionine/arginine decarboxylase-like enzyme
MKLRLDGCSSSSNITNNNSGGKEIADEDADEEVGGGRRGIPRAGSSRRESSFVRGRRHCITVSTMDLSKFIGTMTYADSILVARRSTVIGQGLRVQDAYMGFHIMIDAMFTQIQPLDFGVTMMKEMQKFADLHGVRVVHSHVETFDGSESPPGFASIALIDESHMSAHCYSDQGKRAFDVFTCGSKPDHTRKVAEDVLAFLKLHLWDKTPSTTFIISLDSPRTLKTPLPTTKILP